MIMKKELLFHVILPSILFAAIFIIATLKVSKFEDSYRAQAAEIDSLRQVVIDLKIELNKEKQKHRL